MSEMTIEDRVELTVAVGSYLRTSERFNEASKDFTEACKSLRQRLGEKQKFVVQINYKNYLVTSDSSGNFDVELIESI